MSCSYLISWYNTCAKTFSCSYLQKIYNLLALSLIMFYWALRVFSTLSAIEFRHHAICASVRFSLKYFSWLLLLVFNCSIFSFVHIYCFIVYPIRPLSLHVKNGENVERGNRLLTGLMCLDVEFCLQLCNSICRIDWHCSVFCHSCQRGKLQKPNSGVSLYWQFRLKKHIFILSCNFIILSKLVSPYRNRMEGVIFR